ncbi:DUF3861 domain-containing protein [Zunongwangia endophytica]|uniref:DUF3861 domain-containing protein n=1 Tax=Zunongwangia endophytica TaxID=1808945 RepID=A0ABV8H5E3_9FLAO|nr:DUF3861 domain-containing protein [Zunongwangia endophytica]MDN3595172.1 DUF3861 domain-containing protein [Zunongwangia endophytica]
MKRSNKYNLKLAQIQTAKEADYQAKTLEIDFENHDEIFQIIDRIKEKKHFKNENQSIEFAIGLKLFTEVMLKNRKNELFSELAPEIKKFMTKLKKS